MPVGEVLAETQGLCPRCLQLLPATSLERDGKVYLHRECPEHGEFEHLVLSDASWWKWSRRFVRPGRAPEHHATESEHGCPYDCGFCPEHEQHACVTVFEITEACNLECPACFAGEEHKLHKPLDEIDGMLQGVLRAEGGEADVIMLSGGEPTMHPAVLEIADHIQSHPVRYLILNSNGVRMAREPEFCAALAERDILVYLQWDGFRPETYRTLRGRPDLHEVKHQALANLAAAGAKVVLVATLLKGVNEDEVGALVDFAARHPAVRSISLQPQFAEGRFVPFGADDRMTLTDVIAAIDADSELFSRDDFIPIPCCDPMCTAATYAWVRDGEVTPVTQLVPVDAYLDYVDSTSMPNLSEAFLEDAIEMRDTLLKLFSKSAPAGSDAQMDAFMCACEPLLGELDRVDGLPEQVFAVTIEGFMDRTIFDVSRAKRCCIQEALPDGRIVPFCVYNTLYRFAPDHRPQPVVAPVQPPS